MKRWFNIPLWKRIVAALVAGALFGLWLPDAAAYIQPAGDIFLNAIKMLIMPLIISTLISGVASISSTSTLARLGFRTMAIYLCTTAVAISIGLGIGWAFQPGVGLDLTAAVLPVADSASIVESLVSIVPQNPFQSTVEGDVLPVIAFSILFGVGIVMVGPAASPVTRFFEAMSQVMFKMTIVVMELAPFGVFALIAVVASSVGLDALLPLLKLVVAVSLACLLHIAIIYGGLIKLFAGLSPKQFFRSILDAQLVAFTTTSSSATLPVTMACVTQKLGVRTSTAGFVLPLGATINMDGTALYMGVAALFTAQAYGIVLGPADYGAIILTATLASIGTAGVPAAGLVMMSIVFSTVGLPMEAIGLIAGVDRIMDMFRSMTNVSGDATVSVLVSTFDAESERM